MIGVRAARQRNVCDSFETTATIFCRGSTRALQPLPPARRPPTPPTTHRPLSGAAPPAAFSRASPVTPPMLSSTGWPQHKQRPSCYDTTRARSHSLTWHSLSHGRSSPPGNFNTLTPAPTQPPDGLARWRRWGCMRHERRRRKQQPRAARRYGRGYRSATRRGRHAALGGAHGGGPLGRAL